MIAALKRRIRRHRGESPTVAELIAAGARVYACETTLNEYGEAVIVEGFVYADDLLAFLKRGRT